MSDLVNERASELFGSEYDYDKYEALVDDVLYKKLQNAIIAIIRSPETGKCVVDADVLLVTVAANFAAIVQACVTEEDTACIVAQRIELFFHDTVHAACREAFGARPQPTVKGSGRA